MGTAYLSAEAEC